MRYDHAPSFRGELGARYLFLHHTLKVDSVLCAFTDLLSYCFYILPFLQRMIYFATYYTDCRCIFPYIKQSIKLSIISRLF